MAAGLQLNRREVRYEIHGQGYICSRIHDCSVLAIRERVVSMMRVQLEARRLHEVESLQEASAVCCAFRDANGHGASDMCRGFGRVTDMSGKLIARVSYNGRIWALDGSEILPGKVTA